MGGLSFCPYFRFYLFDVGSVSLCHLPDYGVLDGIGELVVEKGVLVSCVHKEICPVCGIHELVLPPVRILKLF